MSETIKENNLATANPELAKEWHPTKNGDLKPTDATEGSGKTIWWQCDKGHEWEARVYSRKKLGCPICSNKKILIGYNDLATTHPEIAEEWHPSKNKDLNPNMFFAGTLKKVWWFCPICNHEWEAEINSRKQGYGCPKCGHKKGAISQIKSRVEKKGSLLENNPKLASEWHPTKNSKLKPDMITSNSGKKVWWLCNKGHEWEAIISSRNTGVGCPVCNKELRSSFPEQAIYYYLSKSFKEVINSYKFSDQTEIDIYIKDINLGIEYDGEAWHKNIERDLNKNVLCKEKNINLIRVREEKCPSLNDGTFCINVKCKSTLSLENAIKQIYEYIKKNIKLVKSIDININKDTSAINDLFISRIKENSLLKFYPKLAKEWHQTKNGKLKPDMVTATSGKKVWWLGKCGHEWQARVDSRVIKQNNCPICDNKQVLAGFNDLATKNLELAKEWHPTKNGDLKPIEVTVATGQIVWWQCKKGHEWEASMNNRSRGTNCPYCSNQKLLKGFNDLATIRPDLAKEWHPTKNGDLKPSNIVTGNTKKICWLCSICNHEWEATTDNRSRGRGCPKCAKNERIIAKAKNMLVSQGSFEKNNPELAKEWNLTKNGDLKPTDVISGYSKKVWWLGKCGHEWEMLTRDRINGGGCPYCSSQKLLKGFNDLATKNSELAKEWHQTKNGDFKPYMFFPSSRKKVWWLCLKCNHEWEAAISNRTRSGRCPICSK